MIINNNFLIIINIISILTCFIDKKLAVYKKYRIPEKVLLLSCLLGGVFSFYMGMYLFHHKTRKPLFYIGVPIVLIFWIIIIVKYVDFL